MWRNLLTRRTQPAILLCGLGLLTLVAGMSNSRLVYWQQPPLAAPFFHSVKDLAASFLTSLKKRDREEMTGLALNRDEFEALLWPSLPASRPGTNLTAEYVWKQLELRSRAALSTTLSRYGGKEMKLKRVHFAKKEVLGDELTLYRDVRLRVEDADGKQIELNLFGSVIEARGYFKIVSFVH